MSAPVAAARTGDCGRAGSACVDAVNTSSGSTDHDRARRSGGGDLQGAQHRLLDTGGIGNFDHPFRDGAEHLPVVDLLECIAAQVACGDLADQQEERHRVLLRGVHGDRRIAGAGSAADAGDAGPMRQPGIGQGHESGSGLVPAHDRIDVGAAIKRVEQAEIAFARHAEHAVDAMRDQAVDEHLACCRVLLNRCRSIIHERRPPSR